MKLSILLIFVGCVIGTIYAYPFETTDVNEGPKSVFEEVFGSTSKQINDCAMMSIGVNEEKIEEFKKELQSYNLTAGNQLLKVGTDGFDLKDFNSGCTDFANKMDGLIQSLRNEFAKCADEDLITMLDYAIDFFKDFLHLQCAYNEEQLSYFLPVNEEDLEVCSNKIKSKLADCVQIKPSKFASKSQLKEFMCSFNFIGVGQCAKEAMRNECENKTYKMVSVMMDPVLNLIEKKLVCPMKTQSENVL